MGNFIDSLHHLEGKKIIDSKIEELKYSDILESIDLYHKQYHHEGFSIQQEDFIKIFPSLDNIFQQWVQDETKKELDSLEFFAGICIFSETSFHQKLKILYDLFNLNEAPHIQRIELELMLNQVIHATFKIFSLQCNVNESVIQQFLNLSFSNKDEISFQKLYYWAKRTPEIEQFMECLKKKQPLKKTPNFRISPINSEILSFDQGSPAQLRHKQNQLNQELKHASYNNYFQNQDPKCQFKREYNQNTKIEDILFSQQFEQIRNAMLQSYQSLIVSSQFHSDYAQMKTDVNIEKSWVYGFKSNGIYKPLQFIINDEESSVITEKIIYFTGCQIILYCTIQDTQAYYSLHDQEILSLAQSQNGLMMASGENGINPEIHIWCPLTLKNISILKSVHESGVQFLEFIQNDKLLVTAGLTNCTKIIVYELNSSSAIYSTQIPDLILGLDVIYNYVDLEDDTEEIFSKSQSEQDNNSSKNNSRRPSQLLTPNNNNPNNNSCSKQSKSYKKNNELSFMSGKSLRSVQAKKGKEEMTQFFNFQNAFLIQQRDKISIYLFFNNNFVITQLGLEGEEYEIKEEFLCYTAYRINRLNQEEQSNQNSQISEEKSLNSQENSSQVSSSSSDDDDDDSSSGKSSQEEKKNNHILIILTGHKNGVICKWENFQFISQRKIDPKDDIIHTCSFNQGVIVCTDYSIYLMDYQLDIQFQKFSIKDLNINLVNKHINSVQGFYERIYVTTKGGDIIQLDFDEEGNLIEKQRIHKVVKFFGNNSYLYPTPYLSQEELDKEHHYHTHKLNEHGINNNKTKQQHHHHHHGHHHSHHHSHSHHHHHNQKNSNSPHEGNYHKSPPPQTYQPNEANHLLYTISEQGIIQVLDFKEKVIDNIFYFHKKYHKDMLENSPNNNKVQISGLEKSKSSGQKTSNSGSPQNQERASRQLSPRQGTNRQTIKKSTLRGQNSPRRMQQQSILYAQTSKKIDSPQQTPSNAKKSVYLQLKSEQNPQIRSTRKFNTSIQKSPGSVSPSSNSNISSPGKQKLYKSNSSSKSVEKTLISIDHSNINQNEMGKDQILEGKRTNNHHLSEFYINNTNPNKNSHNNSYSKENSSCDLTRSLLKHQDQYYQNDGPINDNYQGKQQQQRRLHDYEDLKITAFTRNAIDQETKKYIAIGFERASDGQILLKIRRWIKRKITNKDRNHKESFKTFDILDEYYDQITKKITYLQFSDDGMVLLVLTEEEMIYAFQYYQETFLTQPPKTVNLGSHHQNSIPVGLDFYEQYAFLVCTQSGQHFYKVDLNLKSRNLSSIEKINLPRFHITLQHKELINENKYGENYINPEQQTILFPHQINHIHSPSLQQQQLQLQQQISPMYQQYQQQDVYQFDQIQLAQSSKNNAFNIQNQDYYQQQQQQKKKTEKDRLQESKVLLGDVGVQLCSISNKIFYFKDRNFIYNNCGNFLRGHSSEIRNLFFKDPHTFISMGKSDGTIIEWKIKEDCDNLIQPFFGPHEGQKLNTHKQSFQFLKNLNDETLIAEQIYCYHHNNLKQTCLESKDSQAYYTGLHSKQLLKLYAKQIYNQAIKDNKFQQDNSSSKRDSIEKEQNRASMVTIKSPLRKDFDGLDLSRQSIREAGRSQTEKMKSKKNVMVESQVLEKEPFFQEALFLKIANINGFTSSEVRNSVYYAHDTFTPYYKQNNLYQVMVQEQNVNFLPPKTPKNDLKQYLDIMNIPELILSQSDNVLKSLNKFNEQTEFYEINDLPYLICHKNCNRLLVYFSSRFFIIKNPETSKQTYYMEHQKPITCFDIHPLNKVLIASTEQGVKPQIHIWNALQPKSFRKIDTVHQNSIVILRFDSDGENLFSVSADEFHSIQVTNWKSGKIISFRNTGQYPIFDLICNPQKSNEFVTGSIKNITKWEVREGSLQKKLMVNTEHSTHIVECISCLAFLNYLVEDEVQSEIIAGNNRGQILFIADETLVVAKDGAHKDKMVNVIKIYELFQEQTVIITAGEDETIKIWSVGFSLLSELNLRELELFQKVPNNNNFNLSVQSLDLFMCKRLDLQYKSIQSYTYDPILLVGMRSGVILEAQFKITVKTLKQQFEIKLKEQKKMQKMKNNGSNNPSITSQSFSQSSESEEYSSDDDDEDDDDEESMEKNIKVGWLTPENFKFHFSLVVSSHSSQEFDEKKEKKKVFLTILEGHDIIISTGDDKLILMHEIRSNSEIFREYIPSRATCIESVKNNLLFIGDIEGSVSIYQFQIHCQNNIYNVTDFKLLTVIDFEVPESGVQKSQVLGIAVSENQQYFSISYDSQRQQKEVSETSQTHIYTMNMKTNKFKKVQDINCFSYKEMDKEDATQVGVSNMNFTLDNRYLVLYYQDIFSNLFRNNREMKGKYRVWGVENGENVQLSNWFIEQSKEESSIQNLDYSNNVNTLYNYYRKVVEINPKAFLKKKDQKSMGSQPQYVIDIEPFQVKIIKEVKIALSKLLHFQSNQLILGSDSGQIYCLNTNIDNQLKEFYILLAQQNEEEDDEQEKKNQNLKTENTNNNQNIHQSQNEDNSSNANNLHQSILGLSASRPRNFPKSSLIPGKDGKQNQQNATNMYSSQSQQISVGQGNARPKKESDNQEMIMKSIQNTVQTSQNQNLYESQQNNNLNTPTLISQSNKQPLQFQCSEIKEDVPNIPNTENQINQKCIQQPKGHASFVNQIQKSNNNKFIFTTGISDENIIKWSINTAQVEQIHNIQQILMPNSIESSKQTSMVSSLNSKQIEGIEGKQQNDNIKNDQNINLKHDQDEIVEGYIQQQQLQQQEIIGGLQSTESCQNESEGWGRRFDGLYNEYSNWNREHLFYLQQKVKMLSFADQQEQQAKIDGRLLQQQNINSAQLKLKLNTIIGRSSMHFKQNLLYDKEEQIMYVSGCNLVLREIQAMGDEDEEEDEQNNNNIQSQTSLIRDAQSSLQNSSRHVQNLGAQSPQNSSLKIQQIANSQTALSSSQQQQSNNYYNKREFLQRKLNKSNSKFSYYSQDKVEPLSRNNSSSFRNRSISAANSAASSSQLQNASSNEKILKIFPQENLFHPQQISCIKQSKDQQLFCIGTSERNAKVILWNLSCQVFLGQIGFQNMFVIQHIAFSQAKQYMVVIALSLEMNQVVYFVEVNSLKILGFQSFQSAEKEKWKGVEFDSSIETEFVLVGNYSVYRFEYNCDGLFYTILDFQKKKILTLEQLQEVCFTCLVFVQEILLIGDNQGYINIESSQKQGVVVKRIQVHKSPIHALICMSEVDSYFITGCAEGKVSIYELLQNCKNKEQFSFLHIFTYDLKEYYENIVLKNSDLLPQSDLNFEIQSLYEGTYILVGTKSGDVYELDKIYDSEEGQKFEKEAEEREKLYNYVLKSYDDQEFEILKFSQNGSLLYCISDTGYMVGHSLITKREMFNSEVNHKVLDIIYIKNISSYLFQCRKEVIFYQSLPDGKLKKVEKSHKSFHSEISKIEFSQDTSFMIIAIKKFEKVKSQIKIYKYKEGSEAVYELMNQIDNLPKTIRHVQFSHDNQYFNFDESEKELGYYNLKNQFLWINPKVKDVEHIKWQQKDRNSSMKSSYYEHLQHLTLQHYKQIFYTKFSQIYQRDKCKINQIILLPFNYFAITDNMGTFRLFQKFKVRKPSSKGSSLNSSRFQQENEEGRGGEREGEGENRSVLQSQSQEEANDSSKNKNQDKSQGNSMDMDETEKLVQPGFVFEFVLLDTFGYQMYDISMCILSPDKKKLVTKSAFDRSIIVWDICYGEGVQGKHLQEQEEFLQQEIDKSFSLINNSQAQGSESSDSESEINTSSYNK